MNNYCWAILLSLIIFPVQVSACASTPYTVGVENIDYSPHYNFSTPDGQSFFHEFIHWLKQKTGCKFKIIPLPIKRLNLVYEEEGSIDFIYPDNPNWHQTSLVAKEGEQRIYSPEIVTALGGTMVTESNKNMPLSEFSMLAIPRGFTPIAWLPLQSHYQFTIREVSDAKAALLMVQAGRADGADVEYNVAQYLIKKHKLSPMVLANNLPYTPTGLHLSTFDQLEMMETITKLILENQAEIQEIKKNFNLLEHRP